MTAGVVVHLLEAGRIPCRNRHPDEIEKAIEVTEWPEHVTCNAACGRRAREEMIRADRQRVALHGTGEVTVAGLTARVLLFEASGPGDYQAQIVPEHSATSLTLGGARAFRRLLERAEELGELMLGRVEHVRRYMNGGPGAPPDPPNCQHTGARVHLERLVCWTCGGSWAATEQGIAAAAAAAAGKDAEVSAA